jgi:DNA-binding beta-propeller fold protein YncE
MHRARVFFFVCAGLLYLTAVGGCSKDASWPTRPWLRLGMYKFVQAWGESGSGNGQFQYPWDVAVDASGNVYVTDTENHRIEAFTGTGTHLYQWGDSGSANGQFRYPMGVAVDASGNVYVTDPYNHRVQKFTSTGTYLTQWGSPGNGDGQFESLRGVAVDDSGNVYVVDGDDVAGGYHHRIQKFTSTGTYLTKWGMYGYGNGQFYDPRGVAVDANGNVYVADMYNNRIQKFAPRW